MDTPAQIASNISDTVPKTVPVSSDSVNPQLGEMQKTEGEKNYQTLFELSNDAIMILDDTGFIDCNKATLQSFGYLTKEEFCGKSPWDHSPPVQPDGRQSQEKATEMIEKAKREGKNFFEWVHRRSGGEDFPAEVLLTPVYYKGKPVILASVRDITDRKKAEDTLKESNELLSLYVANSPIYTYIKSVTPTEGRVVYASNNFNELIGGPVRNVSGKLTSELFPVEFAKKIAADDWKIFSSHEGVTLEENFNGHNYTTIKFPIHLKDKQLIAGYTIDITKRKQSEESLKKSNELYTTTIFAINDGVWDWDVQTGNAFFSETYYTLLGYTDKEFPANYTTWKSLVHPDDVERAEKELQEGIGSDKGFAIQLRMKMKSGEWLWVSIRGKAIEKDKEGKAVRMVGTLTDITKQMQAEQSLQEKIEELERMNSLMVGRETAMVELKEKIKTLEAALGQKGAV